MIPIYVMINISFQVVATCYMLFSLHSILFRENISNPIDRVRRLERDILDFEKRISELEKKNSELEEKTSELEKENIEREGGIAQIKYVNFRAEYTMHRILDFILGILPNNNLFNVQRLVSDYFSYNGKTDSSYLNQMLQDLINRFDSKFSEQKSEPIVTEAKLEKTLLEQKEIEKRTEEDKVNKKEEESLKEDKVLQDQTKEKPVFKFKKDRKGKKK